MYGFETFDMPYNLVVVSFDLLGFSCFRVSKNARSHTRKFSHDTNVLSVYMSSSSAKGSPCYGPRKDGNFVQYMC